MSKSNLSIRPDAYGGYWVTVRVDLKGVDELSKWYNGKVTFCESELCEAIDKVEVDGDKS